MHSRIPDGRVAGAEVEEPLWLVPAAEVAPLPTGAGVVAAAVVPDKFVPVRTLFVALSQHSAGKPVVLVPDVLGPELLCATATPIPPVSTVIERTTKRIMRMHVPP